jgi:hypothetical protein
MSVCWIFIRLCWSQLKWCQNNIYQYSPPYSIIRSSCGWIGLWIKRDSQTNLETDQPKAAANDQNVDLLNAEAAQRKLHGH